MAERKLVKLVELLRMLAALSCEFMNNIVVLGEGPNMFITYITRDLAVDKEINLTKLGRLRTMSSRVFPKFCPEKYSAVPSDLVKQCFLKPLICINTVL